MFVNSSGTFSKNSVTFLFDVSEIRVNHDSLFWNIVDFGKGALHKEKFRVLD